MRKHSKVILAAEEQLVFGRSLAEMVDAGDNLKSPCQIASCWNCWMKRSPELDGKSHPSPSARGRRSGHRPVSETAPQPQTCVLRRKGWGGDVPPQNFAATPLRVHQRHCADDVSEGGPKGRGPG